MLRNDQKRHLRTLAHHTKAIVLVGNKGVTEAVLREIDLALNHHELIKVRLPAVDRQARTQLVAWLCPAVNGELVQSIGRTVMLYRRNVTTPRIQLP